MTALYARYKESGLTRGEIRKKTRKTRPADAPVDLCFISSCTERVDALEITKLDQTQKDSLKSELDKLRSCALKKLN